jgi:predicted SnoaL-like aldol condensation-catalyzing enzyme
MKRLALGFGLFAIIAALAGPALAGNSPQEERNKKNILEFYDLAINQKNYDAAKKYFGATYIQHNPNAANGPEGLKAYIEFLKKTYPMSHSDIEKVFADGNYVICHVHAIREPGTRGFAIVDIFRLDDNGKVVEHWDVTQAIPEKTASGNTMF